MCGCVVLAVVVVVVVVVVVYTLLLKIIMCEEKFSEKKYLNCNYVNLLRRLQT
jgi:hypothetical protein